MHNLSIFSPAYVTFYFLEYRRPIATITVTRCEQSQLFVLFSIHFFCIFRSCIRSRSVSTCDWIFGRYFRCQCKYGVFRPLYSTAPCLLPFIMQQLYHLLIDRYLLEALQIFFCIRIVPTLMRQKIVTICTSA